MSDLELRNRIAELRIEIAKRFKLKEEELVLGLAERVFAAHEILAKLAEKQKIKCYLVERTLGRKCEGLA
jgi:hypothetical protein